MEWLVWDEWNLTHIWERHGIRPESVEEVFYGQPVALGGKKGRIVLIGADGSGRMLTVDIGPVPGQPRAYYTFSARPASRSERRYFAEQKAGGER
jgi:uncharacterized DUF497 family protein